MVEYGTSNLVKKKANKNPPLVIFGIAFGEVSYLDYEPDSKLKVPQNDLLVFFSGGFVNHSQRLMCR